MTWAERVAHASLLWRSYHRWTGRHLLLARPPTTELLARALFDAPFALLSHDTQEDPVFNYGNATTLRLFEMSWERFTRLPSRCSARPENRDIRARLLAEVTARGYIDDYGGIRVSATGRCFLIVGATVWNVVDTEGAHWGQAAIFSRWESLR